MIMDGLLEKAFSIPIPFICFNIFLAKSNQCCTFQGLVKTN